MSRNAYRYNISVERHVYWVLISGPLVGYCFSRELCYDLAIDVARYQSGVNVSSQRRQQCRYSPAANPKAVGNVLPFMFLSCLWHLKLKSVALLEYMSNISGVDMFVCMHADM